MQRRKAKIGNSGKVNIKWKVLPIDYSREAEANIIAKFADKYKIDKANISVEPLFMQMATNGEEVPYTNDMVHHVQDPVFQQSLFKPFLEERGYEEYDFDKIIEIDNLINSSIDYDLFEKNRKYTIKWMHWKNFLCFGQENYIDLTNFKGIIHLASNPANQGGKTTFSLDLLRFLLFGKVTSRENNWVLSLAFNDFLPEETECLVEGCICINDVDYVIRRTLTRPALKKRTPTSKITNKVEYFKLVNNEYIELVEENEEGVSNRETNKIIKESIGNERDFDLMICVSSDNLKDLISLKDTDRGRLIARWIGLLPLEEKDKIAREMFNKSVYPKLTLTRYNKEELKPEIEVMSNDNVEFQGKIEKINADKLKSETELQGFKETRDSLLESKQSIDETLTKVDVHTLEVKREDYITKGKAKADELAANEDNLKNFGEIDFDENLYKVKNKELTDSKVRIAEIRIECKNVKNEIEGLKKGEYCPTCGAKLANVDNTKAISDKENAYNKLVANGLSLSDTIKKLEDEIAVLDKQRQLFNDKNKIALLVEKNKVDLQFYRAEYKEVNSLLIEIQKNKEAIENNNKLEIAINNVNVNIKAKEQEIRLYTESITDYQHRINVNNKNIDDYGKIIAKIEEEEKLVRDWKIYLEMIGKNGISKMLIRNVLPIVNGELKHLLTDVCDFDVEVAIDDRNDVTFLKIHDGVVKNMAGGSGFEQTVAALALRTVLSEISSFSKPSFVVFDEVLGGAADENYEMVKRLYDRIVAKYQFLFQISHIKAIADWGTQTITVTKENNVSRIEVA